MFEDDFLGSLIYATYIFYHFLLENRAFQPDQVNSYNGVLAGTILIIYGGNPQ